MRAGLLGLAVLVPAIASGADLTRPREFWRDIRKNEFAVPEGHSPLALILELGDGLGSRDPEVRDAFGYDIPAAWIHRKKLLSPDDLRVLLRRWSANLKVGLGDRESDSGLLRSFSALDLSVLAAHDLQAPFLAPAEFDGLLDDALAYLRDERDVRGYDAAVGWRHSCAHTADLLKFLARSPRLTPAGQARIFDAIAAKAMREGDPVYVWGEDERMARALLSVVRRKDFDAALLDPWLARFTQLHKRAWAAEPLEAALLAADQNGKNLLRALHTVLSLPAAEPDPAVDTARARVLATLGAL